MYLARAAVAPQDRATAIYEHTLLDEAEGQICVRWHDPFMKNLLDIRDLVESEILLYYT